MTSSQQSHLTPALRPTLAPTCRDDSLHPIIATPLLFLRSHAGRAKATHYRSLTGNDGETPRQLQLAELANLREQTATRCEQSGKWDRGGLVLASARD